MSVTKWLRRLAAFLAAWAALAAPAAAKVAFTGYGSFLFTPEGALQVYGPASVIGSLPQGTIRLRGFAVDSVGLFAATKVAEDADFVMDVNYRAIGATVGELRVQYAYLDMGVPWGARLQAGKVTLPYGYYNSRLFYPFQRVDLGAPVFQGGILGLPIADVGGILSRRFDAGDWGVDVRLFGVNGYGSVPGSTATLRSASSPGGLGIARNLAAGNNNRDIAVGGQAVLGRTGVGEVGASYYHGAWDPSGERLLQLAGAHVHWTPGRWDVLGEYLHLDATGDEGMLQAFGSTHWMTDGAFVGVNHPAGEFRGKPVRAYGRGEVYGSGATNGTGGHEVVRSAAAGLNLRANDSIVWKGEFLWLDYRLPLVASKTLVIIGHTVQIAMVVTF